MYTKLRDQGIVHGVKGLRSNFHQCVWYSERLLDVDRRTRAMPRDSHRARCHSHAFSGFAVLYSLSAGVFDQMIRHRLGLRLIQGWAGVSLTCLNKASLDKRSGAIRDQRHIKHEELILLFILSCYSRAALNTYSSTHLVNIQSNEFDSSPCVDPQTGLNEGL